jgi:hypothetical protein
MAGRIEIGTAVHTRFGKGKVRALRNNRRVLVSVGDRSMEFREDEISPIVEGRPTSGVRAAASSSGSGRYRAEASSAPGEAARAPSEVDLHGLTVEQALERAELALNDALLANLAELRFIHGRSSSLIRSALHRRLRSIGTVRGFRLDPLNEGVTIVKL